ncbi:hypothetical protein PQX77_006751 [Marasmius sp. AFHP31]|nr:hypothetical protein PQX77_006751 [Marasmius sp. AFHP31]
MAPNFPDEIVEQILKHALIIPDKTFSTPSQLSTFFTTGDSNECNLLLVSRQWNRIGIPFLYEAAIIRANVQAVSLWRTLRTNPSRSNFLRRLRIEGGYSTVSLLKIVAACKDNIHTLYVAMDLSALGEIPVLAGLPELRIQSLGLDMNRGSRRPSTRRDLVEALSMSIAHWTSTLASHSTSFFALCLAQCVAFFKQRDFTFFNSEPLHDDNLFTSLQNCTRLERVQVTHVWNVVAFFSLCRMQSLRHISFSGVRSHFRFALGINSARDLVQELEFQEGYDVSSSESGYWVATRRPTTTQGTVPLLPNLISPGIDHWAQLVIPPPHITPLLPQRIPYEVWTRIFAYATHKSYSTTSISISQREEQDEAERKDCKCVAFTRRNILLVCKKFKFLGERFLYMSPILFDRLQAKLFARQLEGDPELGEHVRYLRLVRMDISPQFPVVITTPLPNLEFVSRDIMVLPWISSPSRLQYLSQNLDMVQANFPLPSAVFSHLDALHTLELIGQNILPPFAVYSDALPRLHTLKVNGCGVPFVNLIRQMELPALKELHCDISDHPQTIIESFLISHGWKLTALRLYWWSTSLENWVLGPLDLCHSLVELVILPRVGVEKIGETNPWGGLLKASVPHRLERLILLGIKHVLGHPARVGSTAKRTEAQVRWLDFFTAINTAMLPKLKEIQIDAIDWPRSE